MYVRVHGGSIVLCEWFGFFVALGGSRLWQNGFFQQGIATSISRTPLQSFVLLYVYKSSCMWLGFGAAGGNSQFPISNF